MGMVKIASEIAKREGKKSQVKIGDIREILAHLSDMIYEENSDTLKHFLIYGQKRKNRKKKNVAPKSK